MIKARQVIYFIVLMLATCKSFADDQSRSFVKTIPALDVYSLRSDLLNETITYHVALPPQYEQSGNTKFPIIYVLDGSIPYTITANTAARNLWGLGPEIPPAIVIGLPSNNRSRDYSPIQTSNTHGESGADQYRNFLRNEFFPHIENHYRSNGHRIVIGHSLGGLFALYDLINDNRLFQSYVAVDPAVQYGDDYLSRILSDRLEGSIDFSGRLFISAATKGTSPLNSDLPKFLAEWEETQNNFHTALKQKASKKLIMKIIFFPTEDHLSIVTPSFFFGLRQAFQGYLPLQNSSSLESKLTWQTYNEIAKDPNLLEKHYLQFSKSIGVSYLPEQRLVEASAHAAVRLELYDNAEALFLLNTQNFPDNTYNWEALAEFYANLGHNTKAIAAYQSALKLDPESQDYQSRIMKLSK